jgi:hypothetical protein
MPNLKAISNKEFKNQIIYCQYSTTIAKSLSVPDAFRAMTCYIRNR